MWGRVGAITSFERFSIPKQIALRKPFFITLYDPQCVAIHFNFVTHHRAENGSVWNVQFSVLVTTCTPIAWTFHFYLHQPLTKDDWNPNPQILSTPWNSKGSFFVGTFEKFVPRVPIFSAPLNNKSPLIQKPTFLEHPAISQFSNYTRVEAETRKLKQTFITSRIIRRNKIDLLTN